MPALTRGVPLHNGASECRFGLLTLGKTNMSHWGKTLLLSSTAAIAIATSPVIGKAWAQSKGDDCCEAIEDLQRQILLLQSQLDELKQKQVEAKATKASSNGTGDSDGPDVNVKWKGAPEFSSKDGKWKMKILGRLFADYGYMDGNAGLPFGVDTDDDGMFDAVGSVDPYDHKTEFRTARLGVEGLIKGSTKYKFEIDFAGGDVNITDAYLQWNGVWDVADVKIGQFKTPNSLEELTSSRYITFLERAQLTDAFGLSRQTGVGVSANGDNWSASFGGFGENLNTDIAFDEGWTVAGRATFAPILDDDKFVHVGGSFRYRDISDDVGTARYRQRPHAHISSERFVNTGSFAADSDLFLGGEVAAGWGPATVQAEYARVKADMNIPGMANPSFYGWYVDASVFLTGERRLYQGNKGTFGRVKVLNPVNDGGLGAWQLAVRYDMLDLNDVGISGGEQSYIIAGINWHLNNYTRLMVNYAHVNVDAPIDMVQALAGFPGNSAIVSGTPADNTIDTVTVRAQVDW